MRYAHAATSEPFSVRLRHAADALEQGKHTANRTTFELSSYLAFQFMSVGLWT
jgi:hypothetical protein